MELRSAKSFATALRAGPPKRREARNARREGGSNSVVESQPSKLLVAGSIPVSRSILRSPIGLRRRATDRKPSEEFGMSVTAEMGVAPRSKAADLSAEAPS